MKESSDLLTKALEAHRKPETIPAYVASVLELPAELAKNLLATVSCGEDPAQGLPKLKALAKPCVCTASWGGGDNYFYRCRTCQKSNASCICYDCFHKGNHEGHDFRFDKSGFGGCCDCGNPLAWKEEGFCSDHPGIKEGHDPSLTFPEAQRIAMHLTMRALLRHYVPAVTGLQEDPSLREKVSWMSQWFKWMGSFGDGVLAITRKEFLYSFPSDPADTNIPKTVGNPKLEESSAIQEILVGLMPLPTSPVMDEVLFVLLELLQDPSFKKAFAPRYVKVYPQFLDHLSVTKTASILHKVSPQLWHIPELVASLAQQENLLENFTTIIDNVLDKHCVDSEHGRILNFSESAFLTRQVLGAFLTDLLSIIKEPTVCDLVLTQPKEFGWLVRLLSKAQGMSPFVRKTGDHVEFEDEGWSRAASCEWYLTAILSDLFEGPLQNPASVGSPEALWPIMHEALIRYAPPTHTVECPLPGFPEQTIAHWSVYEQSVSLYVLLHRTASLLLMLGLRKDATTFPPRELFPNSETALRLMEGPLQVFVLLDQAKRGLWVRNGQSTVSSCLYYSGNSSWLRLQAEAFFLQAALCAASPSAWMQAIAERGCVFNAPYPSPPNEWGPFVEGTLRLVLMLLRDRTLYNRFANPQAYVTSCLVHVLGTGSISHGALMDILPRSLLETPGFEEVLMSVAQITPPTPTTPASFGVKKQPFLANFDPSHIHMLMRPRSEASCQEAYVQANKGSALMRSYALPAGPEPLLQSLTQCLHTPQFFFLIFQTLRKATNGELALAKSPKPAILALHLLLHALEVPAVPKGSESINWDEQVLVKPFGDLTMLSMLVALQTTDGVPQDIKGMGAQALQRISERSPKCKAVLAELLPQEEKAPESEESEREARRRKARQRQMAIRARMQKSREAFKASLAEEELEELEEDDEQAEGGVSFPQCALCKTAAQSLEDLLENPVSMVSYAIVSTVPTWRGESAAARSITAATPTTDSKAEASEAPPSATPAPIAAAAAAAASTSGMDLSADAPAVDAEAEQHEDEAPVDDEVSVHTKAAHTHCVVDSCGHHVHDKCFKTYLASLMQSASRGELFEGVGKVDPLNKAEFLCPVCRRIANTMLPVLPPPQPADVQSAMKRARLSDEVSPSWSANPDQWVSGVCSAVAADERPPSLSVPILSCLFSFGLRVHAEQVGASVVWEHLTNIETLRPVLPYTFASMLCTSAAVLDVAGRESGIAWLDTKRLEFVGRLFQAGRACNLCSDPPLQLTGEDLMGPEAIWSSTDFSSSVECLSYALLLLPARDVSRAMVSRLCLIALTSHMGRLLPRLVDGSLPLLPPRADSMDESTEDASTPNSWSLGDKPLPWPVDVVSRSLPALLAAVGLPSTTPLEGLVSSLKQYCLPELRRMHALARAIDAFIVPSRPSSDIQMWEDPVTFEALCGSLCLEPACMIDVAKAFVSPASKPIDEQAIVALSDSAKPFGFIRLPPTFEALRMAYHKVTCDNCGEEPSEPGLCLLCGALVCVATSCCAETGGREAFRHAAMCGKGK